MRQEYSNFYQEAQQQAATAVAARRCDSDGSVKVSCTVVNRKRRVRRTEQRDQREVLRRAWSSQPVQPDAAQGRAPHRCTHKSRGAAVAAAARQALCHGEVSPERCCSLEQHSNLHTTSGRCSGNPTMLCMRKVASRGRRQVSTQVCRTSYDLLLHVRHRVPRRWDGCNATLTCAVQCSACNSSVLCRLLFFILAKRGVLRLRHAQGEN